MPSPISMTVDQLRKRNGSAPIRVAKARTTSAPAVKPVSLQEGTTILTLDLSMSKTGCAWGVAGQKPQGTATVKGQKLGTEGARILAMVNTLTIMAQRVNARAVVYAEFYRAVNDLSFRANCGLRGALLADLAAHGIHALGLPEITARKAAGVDVRHRQEGEENGYMKKRVKAHLATIGLGHLAEDEADAAVLLLGAREAMPTIFQKDNDQ